MQEILDKLEEKRAAARAGGGANGGLIPSMPRAN